MTETAVGKAPESVDASQLMQLVARLRDVLPEGRGLPPHIFERRHTWLRNVIFAHALLLPVFGLYHGWSAWYAFGEPALIAFFGVVASWRKLGQHTRACMVALGLVTSSAVLTQFWGGYIEGHFHFFIMVVLVSLYQDWVPFLVTIGYVGLEHGGIGALAPEWVYNHPAAIEHPWLWGFYHAVFVLGQCIALFVLWRSNERAVSTNDVVLDSIGEGILGLDDAGRVSFSNPAAARLVGVPQERLHGRRYEEIFGDTMGRPQSGFEGPPAASAPGQQRSLVQGTLLRPGGAPIAAEWTVAPLVNNGAVVGSVVAFQDITERRRTMEQLEKARKDAETADRAKSAFLANMSHEIRTPLNAVIGMTSLLLDTELNAEQRNFAATIRASGDHLLTIINDILDLSKIEAGRLELEHVPFGLRDCVETALDVVAPRAGERGIELTFNMEDDVPEGIVGDPARLRQVLLNLLGNAVKFTREGDVHVSIGVASRRPDGSVELTFRVRDTGIGIPPAQAARLFQNFTQAEASTSRKYGGSGLGLAICKRLVEHMGGAIWVESNGVRTEPARRELGPCVQAPLAEPGPRGTLMAFRLPTHEAPAPPRSVSMLPPNGLVGKRALLVDDNAINLDILVRHLRRWGIQTVPTQRPSEALEWVRAGERFDLAILDLDMPDMDGHQLARAIAEALGEGAFPQLLLASVSGTLDESRSAGAPLDARLTKPVKPSVLYDALVAVIAHEPPHDPAVSPITRDHRHMAERLPLSILVAEDNAVNQEVAVRMLGALGYRADVASDGLEAVEALHRRHYDIVLMDVQMPNLDGLDASRRIRAELPPEDQPRIIALTAHAASEDRRRCLAAGMDAYVSKPVTMAALVDALNRASGGPHAPPPAPSHELLDAGAFGELVALLGTGADGAAGIVKAFEDSAPQTLTALRRAVDAGDRTGLGAAAHALKGASGTLAAMALSDLCAELERRARDGPVPDAAERVDEIASTLEESLAALRDALARSRGDADAAPAAA